MIVPPPLPQLLPSLTTHPATLDTYHIMYFMSGTPQSSLYEEHFLILKVIYSCRLVVYLFIFLLYFLFYMLIQKSDTECSIKTSNNIKEGLGEEKP